MAVHWYEEAAEHGEVQAMYELGRLYLSKCGPDKDKAFTWFTIGSLFRSSESQAEAEQLGRKLSLAQKKHAEQAAAKWIKEHPGSDKEEDEEEKRYASPLPTDKSSQNQPRPLGFKAVSAKARVAAALCVAAFSWNGTTT